MTTAEHDVPFSHEVGSDLAPGKLPAYADMLAAFHRASAPVLRKIVKDLNINRGTTILDMACGDGVYGPWLAEGTGKHGLVVGIDLASEFIRLAQKTASNTPANVITFTEANITGLPF
ncbi:MAG: hypothetical protein NVS2B7_11900 [Herpetosiphon sp.]